MTAAAIGKHLRHVSTTVLACGALMNPIAPLTACAAGPHRLSGTVSVSPRCAGPQLVGDDCRAPLTGFTVHLSDNQGRTMASAVTDDSGRFSFSAPSGTYRLHVAAGKIPRCPDMTITLPLDPDRPIHIDCDSGMR